MASAAGLGVVISAPFMGEIRRWIRLEFPGHFVAIVGGAVAIAAVAAVLWAILRIRERRLARYALVALSIVAAIGYARWSALGNPDSDVVERVHFVEYGLIAWLFYRAWLPVGGFAVLALAFFSAATVGTFEEWFQWFIPARVGEVRDVLLNSAAIGCGLLFSIALQPLAKRREPIARAAAHLACVLALAAGALAGFVDSAHLGQKVTTDRGGAFRSIYTAEQLVDLGRQRTTEWSTRPPLVRPPRLGREDQYASEGLLHVQARNAAWDAGDARTAWYENEILETYYQPILDTPSYMSATGHRWASDHRADAARRVGAGAGEARFISRAEGEFPIYLWPRNAFRLAAGVAVAVLIFAAFAIGRRAFRSTPTGRPVP